MEEAEFFNIIDDFKRLHFRDNDNGHSLVKEISIFINDIEDNDKIMIYRYLFHEISSNKNGNWRICLEIVIDLFKESAAPKLENIYNSFSVDKDDDWREDIVMAMLQLKYAKPIDLYKNSINYHLQNRTGRAFYMIVQLCRIDSLRGIEIMSDYFARFMTATDCFEYSNDHHFSYLVYWLANEPNNCIYKIVKQTCLKNGVSGGLLKQKIIDALSKSSNGIMSGKIEKLIMRIKG